MSTVAKYPSLVMIIRHGEKPGDPADDTSGGKHLSVLGSARAAALPSLFTPDPAAKPVKALVQRACKVKAGASAEFSGSYSSTSEPAGASRFSAPAFLFAGANSSSSHRPKETVTALSQAIGVQLQTPFDDNDYTKQAQEILNNPSTYGNQVVLLCWHHGKAPDLAKAFGVSGKQLQGWDPWNPTAFDLVFMITWDKKGNVNFAVDYQELLFGDTKTK